MKITGKDKHMKRILIVEDELYLQKTIKELLEKHGYHTITSSSLSDAMHYMLNIDDIDLFLLDIWLPDGDGFQLCRHIRQRSMTHRGRYRKILPIPRYRSHSETHPFPYSV